MKRCLSTGTVSTDDAFIMKTNKKAKKLRQKNQKGMDNATQSSTNDCNDSLPMSQNDMDDVINAVINPVDTNQISIGGSNSIPGSIIINTNNCDLLKAEINSLNTIIAQLNIKVDFLMSFLGLKDDDSITQPQAQSASQSNPTNDVLKGSQNNSSSTSYANVARSKTSTTQLSSQLRQAVVSAVYVDLHSKSARANNIIVSGLPKLDRTDDKDTVLELIGTEFNIMPTIKQCRRLGKPLANKPQNLLVTLESLDHVNVILSSAKQLRSSYNDFVRANVYINSDLTKAEAAVAYDERCRRRLQREDRSSRQQHHQQQQKVSNGEPSSKLNATVPEFRSTTTISQSTPPLQLINAAVPSFVPAALTSSTCM
jgi:hypothetical protein